jgi:hypothetical protein
MGASEEQLEAQSLHTLTKAIMIHGEGAFWGKVSIALAVDLLDECMCLRKRVSKAVAAGFLERSDSGMKRTREPSGWEAGRAAQGT